MSFTRGRRYFWPSGCSLSFSITDNAVLTIAYLSFHFFSTPFFKTDFQNMVTGPDRRGISVALTARCQFAHKRMISTMFGASSPDSTTCRLRDSGLLLSFPPKQDGGFVTRPSSTGSCEDSVG